MKNYQIDSIKKEFFENFTITDEKQESWAYPCNITQFQSECISERLGEILQAAEQRGREETLKEVESILPYGAGFTDRFYNLLTHHSKHL